MKFTLRARLIAEFIGTAFLVSAVVGSGVMGERLAVGNVAIALLTNTIATWAALVALIATFGSVSEAHFNPVVTLADAIYGGLSCTDAVAYISSQTVRLVYCPSVWHALRHSYRTWLDEMGTSIVVQKELMRHSTIAMTMERLRSRSSRSESGGEFPVGE